MKRPCLLRCVRLLCAPLVAMSLSPVPANGAEPLFNETLKIDVPHISTDSSVKYDYDIVYVRGKRSGDEIHKRFYTDIAQPVYLEPGADLMLLHPDGSEELLVAGGEGSVTDPVVSLDGRSAYYSRIHSLKGSNADQPSRTGADIFKIDIKTRKVVRLTNQRFTPNTGAADWSADYRTPAPGKTSLDYGVMNMGAYPLPGGKIVFTSNRNAFRPPNGYPRITLQLFVMDDRNESVADEEEIPNVQQIGH